MHPEKENSFILACMGVNDNDLSIVDDVGSMNSDKLTSLTSFMLSMANLIDSKSIGLNQSDIEFLDTFYIDESININ